MKQIILIAFCTFIAFASQAQVSSKDEVALLQSLYGMNKKELIAGHMKITQAEADKFWPIYDEYEVGRKKIGTKRAEVIMEYASNYATLSNEKATELIKLSLANQSDFVKLQEKTFKKLSKAITPLRAAQFVQVEVYLENIVRQNLADQIPLIGEIDVTKK